MALRGVLDTSAVIGGLQGISASALPDVLAVSVMTLGELHAGVLAAEDRDVRAQRLRRLTDVQRELAVLDIDPGVAQMFGELRVRTERRAVADLLIAATALAHDATLITRDERQARMLDDRAILLD